MRGLMRAFGIERNARKEELEEAYTIGFCIGLTTDTETAKKMAPLELEILCIACDRFMKDPVSSRDLMIAAAEKFMRKFEEIESSGKDWI